jgi:hypothetical protein
MIRVYKSIVLVAAAIAVASATSITSEDAKLNQIFEEEAARDLLIREKLKETAADTQSGRSSRSSSSSGSVDSDEDEIQFPASGSEDYEIESQSYDREPEEEVSGTEAPPTPQVESAGTSLLVAPILAAFVASAIAVLC